MFRGIASCDAEMALSPLSGRAFEQTLGAEDRRAWKAAVYGGHKESDAT